MRALVVIFVTALLALGASWAMWRSMLVPPALTKVPTPPTARQRQFGAALTPQGEVKLQRKLPADFKPPDGLDETVRAMAKSAGVFLMVNRKAIREAGGNPDAAVNTNIAGMSLGDALVAVTREQDPPLACAASATSLTVTTPWAARSSMLTVNYNVLDLAPTVPEQRALMAQLRADVAPDEWAPSATHPGASVMSKGMGDATIRITSATHYDVAVYLNRMRYRRAAEAFAWRAGSVMVTATGIVALVLAWRHAVRARRRWLEGRCRGCGYDLRASTERCPECGAEITVSSGAGIPACGAGP
jgi:hypothetical protein